MLARALGVATMRLLTHNLLQCNKKGVKNGFPLKIRAEMIKVDETEFNKEFMVHMIQKLDWSALCGAVAEMRQAPSAPTIPDLPAKIDDEMQGDEAFLRALHFVLLDVHLEEGCLICPESGREFPVQRGIPDMLLHDDEV